MQPNENTTSMESHFGFFIIPILFVIGMFSSVALLSLI